MGRSRGTRPPFPWEPFRIRKVSRVTNGETPTGSGPRAVAPLDSGADRRKFRTLIPEPASIEETGLSSAALADLAAKTLYYRASTGPLDLADLLQLPRGVVSELLERMRDDSLVEATDRATAFQAFFTLTQGGRRLAEHALARNGYIGPAPVPFDRYAETQASQSAAADAVRADDVRRALSPLVLPASVVEAIGAAVGSTDTLLLYGPSGNGKSSIASLLPSALPGAVAIPYALDVEGQTIRIFDPRVHDPLEPEAVFEPEAERLPQPEGLTRTEGIDRRYALCRRPLVMLGSELAIEHLELRFNAVERSYAAPPQMKANGGILVVDDLGRQMVRPEDLLNRWIGPMAMGTDHLVLQTGESIRVPFDALLLFATNLDPRTLGDEAFERRIRHKVLIPSPTRDELLEITRREANALGIAYDFATAERFVRELYDAEERTIRGSHPGDILRNLADFARFRGVEPEMTLDLMREAADAFFVTPTA